MPTASIFFVGQPHEVAHHAAPLQESLNVTIIDAEAVLEQARPGDLAIFYSEHFDRFRHACQELKKRNVATLYMIDGILEWRNAWENAPDEVACPYTMRPVLAHKVACIGESQARVLQSWGNLGKTEVVGIPRLDVLSQPADRPLRSADQFRVLVMTAKTPGFTPDQVAKVQTSLDDLKSWQANNPTIDCRRSQTPDSNSTPTVTKKTEFIWRLTGDLANDLGVENQLSDLTGVELAEVLTQVDAVISTPSTAMLEAMKMGLPVAVLDYHNCPHYVTAGWDICASEHIGPVLTQMALRPETRMMFQQNELADSLYLRGDSRQRFEKLVNGMLTQANEQLTAKPNTPLSFPPQMLEPTIPVAAEFRHRQLYESAPEFSIEDSTVLQVELSHARREISHLQGELAQIQSELDQAHQIFEQIEKHPIAGPIVRIRQKMLDLMTTIRTRKSKLDSGCPTSAINPSNSHPETPLN